MCTRIWTSRSFATSFSFFLKDSRSNRDFFAPLLNLSLDMSQNLSQFKFLIAGLVLITPKNSWFYFFWNGKFKGKVSSSQETASSDHRWCLHCSSTTVWRAGFYDAFQSLARLHDDDLSRINGAMWYSLLVLLLLLLCFPKCYRTWRICQRRAGGELFVRFIFGSEVPRGGRERERERSARSLQLAPRQDRYFEYNTTWKSRGCVVDKTRWLRNSTKDK